MQIVVNFDGLHMWEGPVESFTVYEGILTIEYPDGNTSIFNTNAWMTISVQKELTSHEGV